MIEIKELLLKLTANDAFEYLSLVRFLSEDQLEAISTEPLHPISSNSVRTDLTYREKIVLSKLYTKHINKYITVYKYYIDDSEDPAYLALLDNIGRRASSHINDISPFTERVI